MSSRWYYRHTSLIAPEPIRETLSAVLRHRVCCWRRPFIDQLICDPTLSNNLPYYIVTIAASTIVANPHKRARHHRNCTPHSSRLRLLKVQLFTAVSCKLCTLSINIITVYSISEAYHRQREKIGLSILGGIPYAHAARSVKLSNIGSAEVSYRTDVRRKIFKVRGVVDDLGIVCERCACRQHGDEDKKHYCAQLFQNYHLHKDIGTKTKNVVSGQARKPFCCTDHLRDR